MCLCVPLPGGAEACLHPPAAACQSSLHGDHTRVAYSSVPLTQNFVSAERGFQGLVLVLVFGLG